MTLEMSAEHWGKARVGYDRYLCLHLQGRWVVIRDVCKHRGGPLSGGTWDAKSCSIVCPWHQMKNTSRELLSRQLPSVRVGHRVRVILPMPDDATAQNRTP